MRITLITPGFSADEHDWCIPALRDLAGELARRVDLHIITLHYPYRKADYRVAGATVHALGGANARGFARARLLQRAIAATVADQRRRRSDLIHGMWAEEAGLVAAAAARWAGVPAVVSLMGGELVAMPDIGFGGQLGRLGRWLLPSTLRSAARVTVGSLELQRLAEHRIPARRLVRLPLGVDTTRFQPGALARELLPLHEGDVRLLHVASLLPVKDQQLLLRAFARVAERVAGVHLHIVGDGPQRAELNSLATTLGVAGRVTFHGAVPHDRLPDYYRAADLFVLSSRYESQAMVVLEAAACGCPTVGTAVGVLPELAGARAVPVGDEAALADAIVESLQCRNDRAARGRTSLEAVRASYSLDFTVNQLCALYADVLASRAAPTSAV